MNSELKQANSFKVAIGLSFASDYWVKKAARVFHAIDKANLGKTNIT